MSNLKQQLHNLRHYTLSDNERVTLRENIIQKINPGVTSPYVYRSWISRVSIVQKVAVFAAAFLIIVGSTISYSAANALPGEVLYGIKISNEQLKTSLTFSLEKKADLQKVHIVNRLKEASELIKSDTLEGKKKEIVERQLEADIADISKTIATLNASDDAVAVLEIANKLEPTLRAHQDVISEIAAGEQSQKLIAQVEASINQVRSAGEEAITKQAAKEPDVETEQLAQKYISGAQQSLDTMLEVFQTKTLTELTERIDLFKAAAAEQSLMRATEAFEAETYTEALRLAKEARNTLNEILEKLQIETDLKITAPEDPDTLQNYDSIEALLDELEQSIPKPVEPEVATSTVQL